MPDNRNIEALTDQAWERMRELLDQEMPVAGGSKKPPVFWWFWAAAGLLLLLTLGWWVWTDVSGTGTNSKTFDNNADRPTVMDSQPAGKEEEQPENYTELTPAEIADAMAARTGNAPARAPDTRSSTTEVQAPTARPLSSATSVNQMTDKKTTLETHQPKNNIVANRPLSLLHEQEKADQTIAEEELPFAVASAAEEPKPASARSDVFQTDLLPVSPLKSLSLSDLPLPRNNTYLPRLPSKFTAPELHAGIISAEVPGLNGGFVDLRTGLRLSDGGRWSLKAGLGVHVQNRPFTVAFQNTNKSLDQAVTTPDSMNLGPGNGFNNLDQATIPVLVSSSDIKLRTIYLNVPLLLHWQTGPKWSFEAGTRLNCLLRSVWAQPSTQENADLLSAAGYNLILTAERQIAFAQASNSGNNRTPLTFKLNNFYASGTLGLTFRPSVNWQIRAQYQHSLGNVLDSERYRSPERSIWLGVGMRL
jgi:hypothetical protein